MILVVIVVFVTGAALLSRNSWLIYVFATGTIFRKKRTTTKMPNTFSLACRLSSFLSVSLSRYVHLCLLSFSSLSINILVLISLFRTLSLSLSLSLWRWVSFYRCTCLYIYLFISIHILVFICVPFYLSLYNLSFICLSFSISIDILVFTSASISSFLTLSDPLSIILHIPAKHPPSHPPSLSVINVCLKFGSTFSVFSTLFFSIGR